MRNTLKAECLLQAITDAAQARAAHDKARDEYDGPSWGYFGSIYVNAMEDAAEEFQKRLDAYIDERIAAALSANDTRDGYKVETKP